LKSIVHWGVSKKSKIKQTAYFLRFLGHKSKSSSPLVSKIISQQWLRRDSSTLLTVGATITKIRFHPRNTMLCI
jgi:hypothetical protein